MPRNFEWVQVYCDIADLIIYSPGVILNHSLNLESGEGFTQTWAHPEYGVVLRETRYPYNSERQCVHEVPGPTIGLNYGTPT